MLERDHIPRCMGNVCQFSRSLLNSKKQILFLGYLANQARPLSLPLLFRFSAAEIGPSTIIMQQQCGQGRAVSFCFGRNRRKWEIKLGGVGGNASQVEEPRPARFFTAPSFTSQVMPATTCAKLLAENTFLQVFFSSCYFKVCFLGCFLSMCFIRY